MKAKDFPLPHLASLVADLQHELERGRGFAMIRGLPANRFSEEDMAHVFW
jgi:hypothetical protein